MYYVCFDLDGQCKFIKNKTSYLLKKYVLGCYLSVNRISSYSSNQGDSQELLAQQALCDCEFVQLPKVQIWFPVIIFLTRNLKYHLRGTWVTDDE